MSKPRYITGNTEDEIWTQLEQDFSANEELLNYQVIIQHDGRQVVLNVDIDFGGGFESGYETTALVTELKEDNFRFALHKEDFLDGVGKFFGMKDIVLGYPQLDKNVIIKTNDEDKLKQLFANENIRSLFETMTDDFTFAITHHEGKRVLEISIERGITQLEELRTIYHVFYGTLLQLEPN